MIAIQVNLKLKAFPSFENCFSLFTATQILVGGQPPTDQYFDHYKDQYLDQYRAKKCLYSVTNILTNSTIFSEKLFVIFDLQAFEGSLKSAVNTDYKAVYKLYDAS